MNVRPLIWKETRETLIYLWIGWFVFLGLPLIGAVEALFVRSHRFDLLVSPWVASCGGVLAVFVAVGSTCRDLVPRLMDFWQSRPVSPWVWMAIKYAVGLTIVELACTVPVVIESFVTRGSDSRPVLLYLPFLWFLIYSIAFLIGCLVRRTAQAAMFSLVAMVLVWLLPTMVFWLRPFDVTRVMRVDDTNWEEVRFTLVTSALAVVIAIAALLVAQFNLQIRANRRLLLGTIAGAGLLLLASLGFRFGTNMPVLQTFELEPAEFVRSVYVGPNNVGEIGTMRLVDGAYLRDEFHRAVTITDAGMTLGPPMDAGNKVTKPLLREGRHNPYVADADATHWYQVVENDVSKMDPMPDEANFNLCIQGGDDNAYRKLAMLWRRPLNTPNWLHRYQQKLFVFNRSDFVEFDVSDPQAPKEIGRGSAALPEARIWDDPRETLLLPELPGVPARDRLECVLDIHPWYLTWEGDWVVSVGNSGFQAYHLQSLNDHTATYVRTAQHRPTAIENVFGSYYNWNFRMLNGRLYMSVMNGQYNSAVNPSSTVYDVHDGLKQIGHFAAAGAGDIYPLADGRSIVAGRRVYLVGPPPKSE